MSKSTKKTILMNSVVCTATPKQQNILSMFTSAAASATAATKPTEPKKKLEADAVATEPTKALTTDDLTSDDPIVAAFYKSLSANEMIAHRIATTKLGTSYDVTRTRGFLAWSKTR